jgi:hypothetical protein
MIGFFVLFYSSSVPRQAEAVYILHEYSVVKVRPNKKNMNEILDRRKKKIVRVSVHCNRILELDSVSSLHVNRTSDT